MIILIIPAHDYMTNIVLHWLLLLAVIKFKYEHFVLDFVQATNHQFYVMKYAALKNLFTISIVSQAWRIMT